MSGAEFCCKAMDAADMLLLRLPGAAARLWGAVHVLDVCFLALRSCMQPCCGGMQAPCLASHTPAACCPFSTRCFRSLSGTPGNNKVVAINASTLSAEL